jgi:hypothetical protein
MPVAVGAKRMKRLCQFILLPLALLTLCQAQSLTSRPSDQDKYIPALQITETNLFNGKPRIAYRFSEAQLALMARSKLETNRVVAHVERRWPLQRLRAYCVPTNAFPHNHQNLGAEICPMKTEIHKGKGAGLGRMWVYVAEDDGRGTYIGEAGTRWHRWTYSLNVEQGTNHWVIIEQLPNDFMDSPRYDPGGPQGGSNGRQPSEPETNKTSVESAGRQLPER